MSTSSDLDRLSTGDPEYISLVRGWLQNDENFLLYLKKIVDGLDQHNNAYFNDHGVYNCMVELDDLIIVQSQKKSSQGSDLWINIKRHSGPTSGGHDYVWCCPFPTCSKNQLYLSKGIVHLTMCSTGRNLYFFTKKECPLCNDHREYIQSLGDNLREYNVLLNVQELKDLIRSFGEPMIE